MFSRHLKPVAIAFHETFADSGFSMAGAVAYSFVLSLFPFCIFLGALAGYFGGEALARAAVQQLFQLAPAPVVEAIAPEVMRVMGQSRFGPLTIGALIALSLPPVQVESLRAALNIAYRVKEKRSYLWCLAQSAVFVILSAVWHACPDLGRGRWPADGRWSKAELASVAYRSRLDGAAWPLWDRRHRHRWAIARLSSVACRRVAQSGRRLARRLAELTVVDCRSAIVRVVAQHQRLFPVLCRPRADHERARVFSGFGGCGHPRCRAQPRHLEMRRRLAE